MTPTRFTSPFAAVTPLFLEPVDSDLQTFIREAHLLIESCPSVVVLVDADLDQHGRSKKAVRVQDARWMAARTLPLSGIDLEPPPEADGAPLQLMQGRPRTPGYVVAMALLLRGYFGAGFKHCDTTSMMLESITLRVFFTNLGLSMPGRSTLTELVNAVGNETRLRILDAQVALALHLKLDDFETMLQDSTHVAGSTAWPTDSRLMVALVTRLLRVGATLDRTQLPVLDPIQARDALAVLIKIDREIDFSRGKKGSGRERRRRYEKLLKTAGQVHKLLTTKIVLLDQKLSDLDVRPSRKALAVRAVEHLHTDLDALAKVIANCKARVLDDEKVPMATKILSISDPGAGFITKGQRQPVIGYKPQLARSGAGFITGLLLPKGNANDSGQLVPMVDEVIRRTHVTPKVLSVDDGYASEANVIAMRERGIGVVSINGAKGRALTECADWSSDRYRDARDLRSGIESLMFTLKQGFDFGEVTRRGLTFVHAELLEKALAYNLCQSARIKKRAVAEPGLAPHAAVA